MCIPGAIAIQILEKKGVNIETEVKEIGGASDPEEIERILEDCRRNQDSAGGIISSECLVFQEAWEEPCSRALREKSLRLFSAFLQ